MIDLWEHQAEAVEKIAPLGSGALLFDMGCGKTRAALALVERWDCRRILILAPKSVVPVWVSEIDKSGIDACYPLELGDGDVRGRAKRLEGVWTDGRYRLAAVLNYDACTFQPLGDKPVKGDPRRKWDPGLLRQHPWDCLIADEMHRLKDPHGKQATQVSRIAANIPHRLGLTGTPMPHDPSDIFSQYRVIEPRVFGWSFKSFQDRYVETEKGYCWRTGANGVRYKQEYPKIVGFRNLEELNRKVYSIGHRVLADDVLDLPPAMDVERYCDLEKETRARYEEERGAFVRLVQGKEVADQNALVAAMRRCQLTSGFIPEGELLARLGNEKAELLAEVFDEIAETEPVVVFCRFTEDIGQVYSVAESTGRSCCELTGQANDLAEWQAGLFNVLAVQLAAGGVGVDLTRARYCIYFSQNWDSGNWQQTRKRIHRPGQTRPVLYVNLLARNTIDEVVYAALKERRDVARAIIDDMR
jgi:SNF2 family DNA or RNA helicase